MSFNSKIEELCKLPEQLKQLRATENLKYNLLLEIWNIELKKRSIQNKIRNLDSKYKQESKKFSKYQPKI